MLGRGPLSSAPISGSAEAIVVGPAVSAVSLVGITVAASLGVGVSFDGDFTLDSLTVVLTGGVSAYQLRSSALVRRALVADGGIPIRTSALVRRVLLEEEVDVRTSGMVRRVLLRELVAIRISGIVRRVLGAATPCVTRWCRIWTIVRPDGTTYRLTSKDTDLVFGGQTYEACGSLTPSATEGANEVGAVGNMQLLGSITTTGISAADLQAGRLDNSQFEEWEVPWDGSAETPKLIEKGAWGKVRFSEEKGFDVEVTGDGARLLQQAVTKPYSPGCRWDDNIDDDRCTANAGGAYTVTGTVEQALGARSFLDSARTEAAGWFEFGLVTFTSGDNVGVTAEIQGFSSGVVTLWPRLASAPAVGDTYSMRAGCDGLAETCMDKFNNYINFGGYRDVPGQDALIETPNVK